MAHSHKTKSFSNLTPLQQLQSPGNRPAKYFSTHTFNSVPTWANRVSILVRPVKSYSCCRCLLHFVAGWLSPPSNFQYYGNYASFPPSARITMKIQHVAKQGSSSNLLIRPRVLLPAQGMRDRRQQKFISESQSNDRVKTIGLFSFLPQSPLLSLSSFPLSFFNLCLPVFVSDTPISHRLHALRILNGSPFMTNRSIFIDWKVAGLEKCSTLFKMRRAKKETPSFSLFEPPKSCFLCQHHGSFLSFLIYIPGEFYSSSHLVKVKSCICQRGKNAAELRTSGLVTSRPARFTVWRLII